MVNPKASPQHGASLIEALVALVILALGVMGMASIQVRTLVESRTTNSRSVAVQMAEDLLDRMQTNPESKTGLPATNPYAVTWGSAAAPTVNCLKTPCTSNQLAEFDLFHWKRQLSSLLPAGDAQIFQSPTDQSQIGILIGWSETEAKNEAAAQDSQAQLYKDAISIRTGINTIGAGVAGIACPVKVICHLVYIRP